MRKFLFYIWSFVERFGLSAVSFLGNIILANLLLPADFGLVAMLGVFTSLIFTLVDCGMSDGLMREAAPSDRDYNTLFFFNVAMGTILCLIYAGLSPFVASFMGHPQLQPVMAVLGVGALVGAIPIAQLTRLRIQLKFKLLAVINLSSITTTVSLAIIMALTGCGYWSLVALQVAYPTSLVLILALFTRWNLRWEFDVARFKQLWRFSVNLLMSTIFVQLSQNVFAFVMGKYYSPVQAGYMGQAQKLQQTPTSAVEGSLTSTSFVLIAKETDPAKRCIAIVRMLGIVTLVVAIMCGTLIGLSHWLIAIIFPERWMPVVPYLRYMALWGMFYPVCNFIGIVFKLYDRTAVIRNVILVEKALIVVAALTLHPWGFPTVMLGVSAISFVALLVYFVEVSRVTGISFGRLIWTYLRSAAAGLPLAALSLI